MSKKKHDLGLCSRHGCREKAVVAVYPDDKASPTDKGAIFNSAWQYWHKPQNKWFNLHCSQHWAKLAIIVAEGRQMFTYEVIE